MCDLEVFTQQTDLHAWHPDHGKEQADLCVTWDDRQTYA